MSGFACEVAVAVAEDVHTTSVNRKTRRICVILKAEGFILSYDHAHTFHIHSFIYGVYYILAYICIDGGFIVVTYIYINRQSYIFV